MEEGERQYAGMRNVWILTACMTSMAICYTMLIPFLPVYLLDLGATSENVALWSGLVFSITFFVAGIMAPIWGKLADKNGKRMMAIRAAFFIAIAYFLTGLVTSPAQLLLARAWQGFANGFLPAAMTMVSLSVPKERVGSAIGIFQTGLILGNVIGPFLGGLVANVVGMRPSFYFAGCVLLVITLVTWLFVKEPDIVEPTTTATAVETFNDMEGESRSTKQATPVAPSESSIFDDIKVAMKNRVLVEILVLFFIFQSAILMLQPILSLYVGKLLGSMDSAAIISGTILSIGGIAGMVTTNIWTHYGQKRGYFRVITYASFGAGFFLLAQALPISIWYFGILQILVGACIVGVNPSLSAAAAVYTEPEFRGRVFGLVTTAQQFGSMVGPLFASVVTLLLGISYVFMITGIIMIVVSYRIYKRHITDNNVVQ